MFVQLPTHKNEIEISGVEIGINIKSKSKFQMTLAAKGQIFFSF
jgi:hypothetical protein